MEETKRNIISKVLNKDYYLSDEEKYILQNDDDLLNQVFELIPYTDTNNFYNIIDILDKKYSCSSVELKDYISKEMYFKCLRYFIKNEKIASIDLITNMVDLSEYNKEEIKLLEDECLNNKLYENNIYITREGLIELLDNHDYETISRVLDVENYNFTEIDMSEDIITKRMIKEFPFDKYNVKFMTVNSKFIPPKSNIYYQIMDVSLLNEIEINELIERLKNGEQILLDTKLSTRIRFSKIMELDDDKRDIIIKLLFKNSPLLYFYIDFFQVDYFSSYSTYLKKNLIDYIKEDTILPEKVNNLKLEDDKDLIKKLFETNHLDILANNFNCLEYFDTLGKYIKKNIIYIDLKKFIDIYKKVKNKELLSKLLKNEQLKIYFTGIVQKEDIEFLLQNDFTNLVFSLINTYKYSFSEFYINFPNYVENNFINNPYYVYKLIDTNLNDIMSLPNNILEKVFDNVICKNNDIFSFFIDQINNSDNLTFPIIDINFSKLFDIIAPSIAKNKNLSLNNLLLLKNKFGVDIIKYLNNEEIIKIIKMDNHQLQKLINLFTDKKYEMNDLENAFDSVVQSQFINNNIEDAEIFHRIIEYYMNNDLKYMSLIDKILNELDKQSIKYLEDNLNIELNDVKTFILNLLNNIKNQIEVEKSQDILHKICIYYLDKKRGKYKNSINMVETLNLPYEFESTSLNKCLVKEALNEKNFYNLIIYDITANDKNISEDVLKEAIDFYIGNNKIDDLHYDFNDIKKLFSIIIKSSLKRLKNEPKFIIDNYIKNIEQKGEVKKIFKVDSGIDFYQVLSCLDLDFITDNILNNISNYNKLKEILDKFKLNALPNSLVKYLNENNIFDFSLSTIASFINYFPSIMKDIEYHSNNRLNLATIIRYSSVYDSMSSVYRVILGDTDYKLIKANPSPNEAQNELDGDKDYRVKEATMAMIDSFKRLNITIPTFNEILKTKTNKKIRVIVGNLTNPCNMTHGERTGACMRVGGYAKKLFNFCYQNENGFHIRFEDPETGKYISRVSGFRNGNTVVLNQLRDSLDTNYSNDDLVEIIKQVGNKIIDDSKDSSYPIQNVILDKKYAASNMEVVDLGVNGVITGLDTYSDIKRHAVIVASTSKDGFVPLNFDKSNLPTYKVARDIPKKINNADLFLKMSSRIDAIKLSIKLQDYQYIPSFSLENGFIFGIVGDDFYCYLDKDYNVVEDFIGIDERGKLELELAKEELYKFIELHKTKHNNSQL